GRVLPEARQVVDDRLGVADLALQLDDADRRAERHADAGAARAEPLEDRGDPDERKPDPDDEGEATEPGTPAGHRRACRAQTLPPLSRASSSLPITSAKENLPLSRSRLRYASTSSRSSLRLSALMESAMRFSRASTCVTSASTSSPIL